MRILLSSIACAPYGGSEGIYGWRACRAIARDHEVWIILDIWNKEGIEKARTEGLVPDSMHFVYVGEPLVCHPNRMVARINSWLSYIRFQKQAYEAACGLVREIKFDAVHHITYTSWRVAPTLWKLPLPFIWGPISGTEMFPLRCLGILSPLSFLFEVSRFLMNGISLLSPSVWMCSRESRHIIAIHGQSRDFLCRLRGTGEGISVYNSFFMDDRRVADLERNRGYSPYPEPLQIFAGGNLEGRKGVAIALEGLALARKAGVPFHYHVSSRGPELQHLQKLVNNWKLSDHVVLGEAFPRGEFETALKSFDVYLLPSLREGGGLSMMEAMLAGAVPIVADCGGPGGTVESDCGFKIPVTNPGQMAGDIAKALQKLHLNRDLLPTMGTKARQRIITAHGEDLFRKTISQTYRQIL